MPSNSTTNEPCFVFGSDLDGKHETDSAQIACRFHGAETGVWSGVTGNAYVIPYLNSNKTVLPIDVINNYVEPFVAHAEAHSDQRFHIARFACGQSEHDDEAMARLFSAIPSNCLLPGVWRAQMDAQQPARLLVFDPGAYLADSQLQEKFEQYLSINAPLWNCPSVEIVSVGNAKSIVANESASKSLELKHRVIAAKEPYYGANTGMAAEYQAIWYATHVLSISDFDQTANPQQMRVIRSAARAGLPVDQMDVSDV